MKFKRAFQALKYAKVKNAKVGISSNRIPMLEFEYFREIADAIEDMKKVTLFTFGIFRELYGDIEIRPDVAKWMCFRNGMLYVAVTDKSVHYIMPLCFMSKDEFLRYYNLLTVVLDEYKTIDKKYIEYVKAKGYATLRISWKRVDDKIKPPPDIELMAWFRREQLRYRLDVKINTGRFEWLLNMYRQVLKI